MQTFDLDSFMSDSPRVVGQVKWISSANVPIIRVAPCQFKKAAGKTVITTKGHNFSPGDRIYLHNVSPGIDGFHIVEAHPDPSVDPSKYFLVSIQIREPRSGGEIRWLETYDVISPNHLAIPAQMELKSLQYGVLESLKTLSPERYRYTMLSLLGGVGGVVEESFQSKVKTILSASSSETPEAIAALAEQIATAAKRQTLSYSLESITLSPGVAAQIIEAASTHDFTHDNLIDRAGASLEGLESELAEINPSEISKIEEFELRKKIREVEILCGMPSGTIGDMRGIPNLIDIIRQLYESVTEMITQSDAEEGEGNGEGTKSEGNAPKRTPKKPKPSSEISTATAP